MAFAKICAAITLLATVGAVLELFDTLVRATSAPQQAAGASIAIATAVIPYVFTRCVRLLATPTVARVEVVNGASPALKEGKS